MHEPAMTGVDISSQSMTLGRFVRITLQNFRLLINTFSGSTAALPMSDSQASLHALPEHRASDDPLPADGDALPADSDPLPTDSDALSTDSDALPTDSDPLPVTPPVTLAVNEEASMVQTNRGSQAREETHHQPALNLPPIAAAPVLAAESASGELVAHAGAAVLPLASALESLLFVADAPVESAQLARVLNAPVEVVETHLRQLDEDYRTQGRGLRVAERNGRFQMVTTPAAAALIEAFLNLDVTTRLSAPALETLAVVAYRQPVTRAQVEAVRGVDCSGILRSLLQRGLVEEVDRLDAPGRPVRYGITDLFMQHFGLTSLHELPPLESSEAGQLDEALDRGLP